MDAFKDIFQEFKDRIRNPLFSSFAIAWIFFNWRITVALIFYNEEILKKSGYNTFNNLIDARQDNYKMLIFPFLSACVYVFGFPYIRNFINEFLANRKIENENRILDNSKKSSVKLERYIDLLKELENQQKLVGDIYSEQKKELDKTTALQSDLIRTQELNTNLQSELAKANQDAQAFKKMVTIPVILNGRWDAIFEDNGNIHTERWTISGEDIYAPDDRILKIRAFLYNPATNLLHFTLTDEIRTPGGTGVFYITEEARKSYLMSYIPQDGLYVDAHNSFSLKHIE
ncbi:hypothetical protein ACUN24_00820 [Pedobacter sp. WC2501]|uniref:hypothetical protein n=1 Tax=Pedobacter sp. WC2501 TaxID=3461400 RepID=UPI004045CDE7